MVVSWCCCQTLRLQERNSVYRNHRKSDRIWLNNNSPKLRKPKASIDRVDWNVRDKEILAQAKNVVRQLLKDDKPVRITVGRVGSSLGLKALFDKHLDKLNVQGNTQRLMDLTGNGQVNLVVSKGSTNGYYEANSDRTWQSFQTFPAFPNDFSHPDNQLLDITGDGLTDIVRLDGDRIWVYLGKGKEGFDKPLSRQKEREIPLPRKGSETEIWQFTDMFGSGMQQLVKITNGLVECWASLGYGKFGKRVLLDNAPRYGKQMDAARLFLADLDGSGTADLIYVDSDRVEIWFNQSGNSFSEPITVYLPSKWDKGHRTIALVLLPANPVACGIAPS